MTDRKLIKVKKCGLIIAWGLYDLANQFFALNIVSLYFVLWLTQEKRVQEIYYSLSFGFSIFLVAISAPILGAISDITKRRRPFLIYLTLISIICTMALGISENILLVLFLFVLANYGCQTAIIFYNALMVNIAPKDKTGLVSGFGRMLGYTGAILALYITKPIVLKMGYQAVFLPTGILFLIFALPCLVFVRDKNHKKQPINIIFFIKKKKIFELFGQLKEAFFSSKNIPGLSDFLKAIFFGLCVVNVIILFMSVYAKRAFGLHDSQIIDLIAFSAIFAIVGSISSGFISDYIGHRRCLIGVFGLWVICLAAGMFAKSTPMYLVTGALAGTAMGSTWAVSRALIIKLVPAEKIGEIFGLFNLVGCLSAVAGALFWGIMLLILRPLGGLGYRIALFSLNIFFIFAFIFLLRLKSIAR